MLKCYELLTEYRTNPVGIDGIPRFSWKLSSDNNDTIQTAYHIIVDGLWDSQKVQSEESIHIPYKGAPLSPKTRYSVKVKVWDNHGGESDWVTGYFETGLSDKALWKAKWLTPCDVSDVVPVFSKEFSCPDVFSKARLYATAYGIYDAYINGRKVSDVYLTPGFTSYKNILQYQTYEIEEYLTPGVNKIEIYLSKGWCCGRYPFQKNKNPYHMKPSLLAQMEIDGIVIPTDESWECTESRLRLAEIYDGETFDNSMNDFETLPFSVSEHGYDNLTAQISDPVRIIGTVLPTEIIKTPAGETVIDFGQNLVGFVDFKVSGKKGDKVIISHAEVLDKYGNFYTKNLRTAKQRIEYILNGGCEEYHSRMTFQGFRYIRLDEYPGDISPENFKARVICTDMKRTGHFESSHKLLNKLYENIIWSHKGNFVDIPTDCPQRDERAGWTGDTQVFCKTAAQNMNTALFFKKWLGDLAADQTEDGCCLILVPSMNETVTSSGWGDAAVICPWEIYQAYGDRELLKKQYPSMKKWIEYLKNQGDNEFLWNTGHHFGDWLALDMPESMRGATSHDFIASAYYAYSTYLVLKTSEILEIPEDTRYFSELYSNIIENIRSEFITKNGRLCDNTQTAYALSLAFNLTENRERAAKALNELVEKNDNKLTTGFIGTPYLCDALFDNGFETKAFDLLLQEEYPSWLFSVKMGATTIWEHWDGIKPDGEFWRDTMNSYNHYAYGAIADFMYKKIGGISPASPGYKKISIKPWVDSRITKASASIDTVYGVVKTDWEASGGKFTLNVTIPCNTTAVISLPDGTEHQVGSGSYEYCIPYNI